MPDLVEVFPAVDKLLTRYKAHIWSTYCECVPAPSSAWGAACADGDTYTLASVVAGGLVGENAYTFYALTPAVPGSIKLVLADGTPYGDTYSNDYGYQVVYQQTAGPGGAKESVYDVHTGVRLAIYNFNTDSWRWCPAYAAPDAPTDPGNDPNDDSIPDPPAGETCTGTTDICRMLNEILLDLRHTFAALGSATDRSVSLATDLDDRLTTLATGVSSNASQLTTVQAKEDAIKADVDALLPLVDETIAANLGCPPAEVSGDLLAFLPAALHAMNTPICALQPPAAYTLGELTAFTTDLELSAVDGILLTLPALIAGDELPGAHPLYKYGYVAWGSSDGLTPMDGSTVEIPTWSTSVLLLAPNKLTRRAYVHLYGGLTAHYQVVSYS